MRGSSRDAWCSPVWNGLTGRAVDYGIKDYDVFYFDPDTSWQAEDAVIARLQDRLSGSRRHDRGAQQARVHLWYPQKHGKPYPALRSSTEASTAS